MSEKTQYLKSVTAQLQQMRTSLAKLRAHVRTRKQVSVTDQTQLKILQSSVREIRTKLAELAAAKHDEWPSVRMQLDQRLTALKIPTATELSSTVDFGADNHDSAKCEAP